MKENQIEIIKKVRAIENEMSKRRGLDRLVNYNSGEVVHKKQMEFHKCDKKNRWVFGGNRTGKTECGAVETVWLLRGIHPYKKNKPDVTGWVVSVSYEVQREVAQQKILSYLSPAVRSRARPSASSASVRSAYSSPMRPSTLGWRSMAMIRTSP